MSLSIASSIEYEEQHGFQTLLNILQNSWQKWSGDFENVLVPCKQKTQDFINIHVFFEFFTFSQEQKNAIFLVEETIYKVPLYKNMNQYKPINTNKYQ